MGKHSAGSDGHNPFARKHGHLTKGTKRRKSLRTVTEVSRATGERIHGPVSRRRGPLEVAPARLKAERERRKGRRKRVVAFAAITTGALLVVFAVAAYAYLLRLQGTMQMPRDEGIEASLAKAKPQEPYTVLILGGDKRKGDEVYRTDTMILAKVDPQTEELWMISIPRDTKVQIPGRGSKKINQAFSVGGAEAAIDAVNDLTGVPINHYMQVDFEGFKKVVDAIGGVWVDVPVEIDDWDASSHSRNHSARYIDKGYQLLDGAHALTFVRARHQFVDQDFSRMRNQQIFFKALADQVASTQNVAKLPKVITAIAPHLQTDMGLMDMIRTAQALSGSGSKKVYTATIPGEWRSPYVIHDSKKMEELIERMNAGVSFDATVTPTRDEGSSGAKTAPKPKDITLTVRNGGGIAGCAKQSSSILKARGFTVSEVGNANQFIYEDTLVVYKDDRAAAEMVAAALAPGTKIVQSRGMYSFKTKVLVVVGKDWDLSKIPVTPISPGP